MPSARDIVVFALGALAGGAFVRWYVKAHKAEIAAEGVAAHFFGESSPITGAVAHAGAWVDGLG